MHFHKARLIQKTGLRTSSSSTFQKLASEKKLNDTATKSAAQYDDSYFRSDKYQFLHKSPVHTLKFQASLPRLKIPKLDETCKRYLDSQKAITDDPEVFKNTESIVTDFMKSEGVSNKKKLNTYHYDITGTL